MGINFSFPIDEERLWGGGGNRSKRVVWKWVRRREGKHLENRRIFWGKSQIPSFYPPSHQTEQRVKDWTRFSH